MSDSNTKAKRSKPLRRFVPSEIFHYVNGERVKGPNQNMSGNCSNLHGDCTGLEGDLNAIPTAMRPCFIAKWVEREQRA